jgi:hypothetical protein
MSKKGVLKREPLTKIYTARWYFEFDTTGLSEYVSKTV